MRTLCKFSIFRRAGFELRIRKRVYDKVYVGRGRVNYR